MKDLKKYKHKSCAYDLPVSLSHIPYYPPSLPDVFARVSLSEFQLDIFLHLKLSCNRCIKIMKEDAVPEASIQEAQWAHINQWRTQCNTEVAN